MGSHGTDAPEVKGDGNLKPLLLLAPTAKAVEEDLVVEQPGPPHPTTRAMRGAICGGAGGQFPVSEPSLKEMDDWEEKGMEHPHRVAGGAWPGITVLLGCIILGTTIAVLLRPLPVQLQYRMFCFLVTMYFSSHKSDLASACVYVVVILVHPF